MKFNYIDKAYLEEIEYKKQAIDAILDTGATNTTIDIKSLSELLGVQAQSIYDRVSSHISKWPAKSSIITASGNTNRTIEIKLKNIVLAGYKFPEFYLRLNVDNDSWIENISDDRSVRSYVLIGLDIIRNTNIQGNKDYIELLNFDYKAYIKKMQQTYTTGNHNIINLFEALENKQPTSSKPIYTKEDVAANLINKAIQKQ